MTHDLSTLIRWIRICLTVAAVCSTSFPVLYSFSPWYRSAVGRALMLQSAAFAAVIDLTALFQFWHTKNLLLRFWLDAIMLTLISVASVILTVMLYRANYRRIHEPDRERASR